MEEIQSTEDYTEYTPEQLSILRRIGHLGLQLYLVLNEEYPDTLDQMAKDYQGLGTAGKRSTELLQKIPNDIELIIETKALEISFDLFEDFGWQRVLSAAMRIAGSGSGYFWTQKEIDIIVEHYQKLTDKQLAEILPGRSYKTINMLRQILGLKKFTAPTKLNWVEEKVQELIGYVDNGLTDPQIARLMGTTSSAIKSKRRYISLRQNTNWEDNAVRFRQLFLSGMTFEDIANELNISVSTVARQVKAMRLTRKKPKP